MPFRIEVAIRPELSDPRGNRFLKRVRDDLGISLGAVRILSCYHIDKPLDRQQLERCRQELFTDPVTERSSIGPLPGKHFDWMVEIGFLPGVTDNVGHTSREAIEDLLRIRFEPTESVYSTEQILLTGELSRPQVERIAALRFNPLIQTAWIQNSSAWRADPMDNRVHIPKVQLARSDRVDSVSLDVSDEELARLGREGILERVENGLEIRRGPLALELDFLKTIRDHFHGLNRLPTDVELETLAQTWSEHCKHNIFAACIDGLDSLYRTYIQGATREVRARLAERDWCLSVFKDNSGVIRFNEDWSLCYKVETHNSPSALDPYGGAITGIVGVNRDPLGTGMGARLIVNLYGFCFGDPYYAGSPYYRLPGRREPILHPKVIFEGVREGVEHGGNKSGIPTAWGFLAFDPRYMGKPLVFVGTVGLLPAMLRGRAAHQKAAQPGDRIIMTGGRVGKDGIHGATFSSEAMHAGSPATAVQIGDPITQKKMGDAQLEIRDLGLYHSVTDNGAGGLSCSVAEMARECGGCRVELGRVPTKYEGLLPYEIWISESQERMTYAVPPENVERFCDVMRRRGVEATVIGEFTASGRCMVEYKGRRIVDLDMHFLHEGVPQLVLSSRYRPPQHPEPDFAEPGDPAAVLERMLGRLNLCSREYVVRQFDHEVLGQSVIKPLTGRFQDVASDAAVMCPLLDSPKGIALSHGLHPSYGDIDPYWMAACSIDTAIRNVVTVGADPEEVSLLDNFCWCSSNDPERLGQLKRATKACYDLAVAYLAPFISGKDSMFNDFKGYDEDDRPVKISVPPTLLISSIGIVADVRSCVTLDLKAPGERLYLLGNTRDELGASEYYGLMGEARGELWIGSSVPRVDAELNLKIYRAYHQAVRQGLVSAAASVGAGGLALAASRMAMGGNLGLDIDLAAVSEAPCTSPHQLNPVAGEGRGLDAGADMNPTGGDGPLRSDRILYSESQGRILVSVSQEQEETFKAFFAGLPCSCLGRVIPEPVLRIRRSKEVYLEAGLDDMRKAYKETLAW